MKLSQPIPVTELAARFRAELIGDDRQLAVGINEVHQAGAGDIIFVDVEKYYHKALRSAAGIILIDKRVECPAGKTLLVVERPFAVFNELLWAERPSRPLTQAIHPTAVIGEETFVEVGAVIGPDVTIGRRCHIQANVVIGEHTLIGDNVIIQSGSVIGSDAFYYKKTKEGFIKWRSGGRVVIGDGVDIGANCTINRGVTSDTVIGAGSKLDCQVQIGHDVKIGRRCLLAAQVGVAGNSVLEDEVVLYGQVGVAHNLHLGAGAVVLAKSGVHRDLPGGKKYFGTPVQESTDAIREMAFVRRMMRGEG